MEGSFEPDGDDGTPFFRRFRVVYNTEYATFLSIAVGLQS